MDLAGSAAPPILVACALKRECSALRRELTAHNQAGSPPAYRLDFLITGIGLSRTQASLLDHFSRTEPKPSLMVFTGTAGQLDPSLAMGETVCPASWALSTGEEYEVTNSVADRLRSCGFEVSGRALTVRRPVLRASSRAQCFKEAGARICDMEAFGALKIASLCGVPCIAPKVVSDTGDASFLAFWAHFDRNMARLAEYLRAILPIVAG